MKNSLSRTVTFCFLIVIIIGTLLLKLTFAATTTISWVDALFTATSATTVTGLIVVSTGHDYTLFGQVVIACLIQIGGLGLLTFAVMVILSLGKKLGLRQRLLVQEALGQTSSIGGVVQLIKILLLFSVTLELIGMILLSIQWVPEYGWAEGLYQSFFHAISAFNNAGFSLWDDSLSRYVGDPLVNTIISLLFITGGIGFIVIYDLWNHKKMNQWSLHTKLMLIGTFSINMIAMLVIFFLEYTNPATLGGLHSLADRWWGAFFQAVTPRTAGFNTLDIGSMYPGTIVFILILMFIGAGSASTGSGVKLTTFIVIVLATMTFLRGQQEPVIFGRTIKNHVVLKSLAIVVISLLAVFTVVFILTITEDAPFLMIVFEAFSAFGTVGLSMGLTADLSTMGKLVIIVMMFIGRIGPLTLAFSISSYQNGKDRLRYPEGQVFTG